MDDERHIPQRIKVSQTPLRHNRSIEIDGVPFPFYTYGPINCEEHPTAPGLRIVLIPVVCNEAEFSNPDS